MGWKLTVSGHELAEEDVEAGHLIVVAEMAGVDSWAVADPMASPKTLAAWVAAVIALNVPEADASTANFYVAKMKASDLVACYSRDDMSPPPEAANGDNTPVDRAAFLRQMAERAKG